MPAGARQRDAAGSGRELFVRAPRRSQSLPERGDTHPENVGGDSGDLRDKVPDVLLAQARDRQAELLRGPPDRVAEMHAVGCVDLRVRRERVLERADGLSGGEKEAGGDNVVAVVPDFREGRAESRLGEATRALLAAFEEVLRTGQPDLFGRVVRLLRAGDRRIRNLDPAAQEDIRRAGIAGDGDQRRPARVRTEAEGSRDRGEKSLTLRNSSFPAVL